MLYFLYIICDHDLEQKSKNCSLLLKTTLVKSISNNIEDILQKIHIITLIELISNVLVSIYVLLELDLSYYITSTLKMRIKASRPDSKIEGSSCLIAQTIQSITVLNCSAGILNNAFKELRKNIKVKGTLEAMLRNCQDQFKQIDSVVDITIKICSDHSQSCCKDKFEDLWY